MKATECPKELLAEINVLISEEPPLPFTQTMEQGRLLAIQRVARANNIPLQRLSSYPKNCSIEEIGQIEAFRVRQVQLPPNWWKYDNGHLLGQLKQGKESCALIYRKGRYWLFTKSSQTHKAVTEKLATQLSEQAYYFYQGLSLAPITLSKLAHFVWPTIKSEILRLGLFQLIIGLLVLFIPIATAKLFSDVIPSSDHSLLIQWTLALFFNVIIITGFSASELISEMRLRFKINRLVQSAFWDRILRLPVNFFKTYTVGDLATRTDTFDRIQSILGTSVLHGVVQSIFGLIAWPLMIYYNLLLGICSSIVIFIFAVIYFLGLRSNLAYQRQLLQIKGVINGLFIEFINGISRLRTTNSESRFFSVWAHQFLESIQADYKEQMTRVLLNIYSLTYPLFLMMLVFALSKFLGEQLKFADFIGFNAALTLFMTAILGLVSNFTKLIDARSLYERVEPLLSTEPEIEPVPYSRQKFSGAIQIQELSFKITQNRVIANKQNSEHLSSAQILDDISLTASPGEYIALVGPSGAGKSTLFRLLLGFEKPSSGRILYDKHDLTQLNKTTLRRQLGVVLQGDRLFSGTLFENICGNVPLTLKEAWEIADLVEMADEIRAMPMGMVTLVMENSKTISSGQRQRLLIARALSHRPSILLLDEATSMLDNLSLSKIHNRLGEQQITRIVITQRLNTIQKVDHIYVLEAGRIMQHGTYGELLNTPGWFQRNLGN